MELLKKHVDTVVVLGGILSAMLWMNGKFNDVDRRLIRIETILIMKGIMPSEMIDHNDKTIKKEISQ
jgi:hypothetical protein